MSFKVVFDPRYPDAHRLEKCKLREKNQEILETLTRMVATEKPFFKERQIKALAVKRFLHAAGFDILCVEAVKEGINGISLYSQESQEYLGFIQNNCVLICRIYDMYFEGVFDSVISA